MLKNDGFGYKVIAKDGKPVPKKNITNRGLMRKKNPVLQNDEKPISSISGSLVKSPERVPELRVPKKAAVEPPKKIISKDRHPYVPKKNVQIMTDPPIPGVDEPKSGGIRSSIVIQKSELTHNTSYSDKDGSIATWDRRTNSFVKLRVVNGHHETLSLAYSDMPNVSECEFSPIAKYDYAPRTT